MTEKKKRSQFTFLFISQFFCFLQILASDPCDNFATSKSYLDAAIDLIGKAKLHTAKNESVPEKTLCRPMDCDDVLRSQKSSGTYTIWPRSRLTSGKPVRVYCDMDTDGGGWTVIQRRGNYGSSMYYFYRDWANYKNGFGDVEEDFWLGNDNIFALTNQGEYSIRFDLENKEREKRYALYENFWIDNESEKYRLHIEGYSGNAGESMFLSHENQTFTTKDKDNDLYVNGSCSHYFKGAWWYSDCYHSNLNGLYETEVLADYKHGIRWNSFTNKKDTLIAAEMKIRPKNFKKLLTVAKNT